MGTHLIPKTDGRHSLAYLSALQDDAGICGLHFEKSPWDRLSRLRHTYLDDHDRPTATRITGRDVGELTAAITY